MIAITRAGTFSNACHAGLVLSDADEYGEIEWLGTRKQWNMFDNMEMGDQLYTELYG